MAYPITGHYHLGLVGLSLGIAVLASHTTLSVGRQMLSAQGRDRWPWLMGGGLAMGTGIWATHFIAMLALELPIPIHYDAMTTLLSLLYAVLAAGIALAMAGQERVGRWSALVGGGLMGLAIAWMHYTGMAAMEMPAHLNYRWPLVALSLVIAVGASSLALGLTLSKGQQSWNDSSGRWTSLATLTLALAIGGLHYTGMAAALFVPSSTDLAMLGNTWPDLDVRWIALAVSVGAGGILMMALTVVRFNRRLQQQQLSEKVLADSERRFRTLIRDMGVAALLLNNQAEILICNQAAQRLLCLPEALELSQVFGQYGCIWREDGTPYPRVDLPVQRAIAQKRPLADEVIGVSASPNDPPRWLLIKVDPQLDEAGQVERVVCTCSDITIQKQAEEAIRSVAHREQTVLRIVQRMRQTLDIDTIFDATTQELQQAINCDRVWIYRFNPDWSGTVVAEALTDPEAQSTLIQHPSGDRLIDEGDCSARQLDGDVLEDGYLLLEDTYLKTTQASAYRKSRTYHCVNDIYDEGFNACYVNFLEQWQVRAYVIVPIFAGSQLWGLLGIYNHQPRTWNGNEVKMVLQVGAHLGTAVQQANLLRQTQQQTEALEVAKRAADAASQAKGEFLAGMSHELRTPLNAILGFTQILHDDPKLNSDHRDLINIVNRSGNHLLGLINNVLSLAKIEANKITLNERAFGIHHLLQSVNDMLQIRAESRGIRLQVEPPPPLPHQIWADEGKLRQILINLVGNAIKFTSQGQVTVRARISGPCTQGMDTHTEIPKDCCLEIEVQDTGVGMAPEELKTLFQPFQQTQSGRGAAEGTGLGLSLSHNFAQIMGGTITVASAPNLGSTFTLSVPVGMTDLETAEPSQPGRSILHLEPGQPSPRILVADDVAASRLLMRHWLEAAGFEVKEAVHGREALEIWEDWSPHLICLDMRMPILDGYGVARHIRQTPGPEPTAIIAVTASVFEEQQSDCITAGCDRVLPKPLQRETLLEHVGQQLGLAYQYVDPVPLLEGHLETNPALGAAPLKPEDFEDLPTVWVERIHQAAQAADDRQVRQLIAELDPSHQALAQRLRLLVNDFRLDLIIDLAGVPLANLVDQSR